MQDQIEDNLDKIQEALDDLERCNFTNTDNIATAGRVVDNIEEEVQDIRQVIRDH